MPHLIRQQKHHGGLHTLAARRGGGAPRSGGGGAPLGLWIILCGHTTAKRGHGSVRAHAAADIPPSCIPLAATCTGVPTAGCEEGGFVQWLGEARALRPGQGGWV